MAENALALLCVTASTQRRSAKIRLGSSTACPNALFDSLSPLSQTFFHHLAVLRPPFPKYNVEGCEADAAKANAFAKVAG